MKAIIVILIISLEIASCQTSNIKEQRKLRTFDLREQPKITEVMLSELGFVDIEYIPLETNDQSVVSHFGLKSVGFKFISCNAFYIIQQYNTILKFRDD